MKILLGGARDNNIIDQVKENLIFHGYEVIDITLDNDYKYKNFGEKLINFFNKTLLNSLQYKAKLRINDQYPNIIEKIKTENITHGLIIRPDRFPLEFVSFLRSEIEYLVGYQWDGMHRFPEVKKYKKFFNKFFVFDPVDVTKTTFPTTNFYFDHLQRIPVKKGQVYFIGRFLKNRINKIEELAKIIKDNGLDTKFLVHDPKNKLNDKQLKDVDSITEITYGENLKNVLESEVIVDFMNVVHHGLSFRAFEALGYDKKLITNNPNVKFYDFYHPHNIFVWEDSFDGLAEFLKKPYHQLPTEIKEKYGFKNWISYMLNLPKHQKIDLPKEYTK